MIGRVHAVAHYVARFVLLAGASGVVLAGGGAGCSFDESGVGEIAAADSGVTRQDAPLPLDLGPDVKVTPLPDLALDGPGGCVCEGGKVSCAAADSAAASVRDCPLGCNKAGDDCARFEGSNNVSADLMSFGAGDWTVSGTATFDTSTGALVGGTLPGTVSVFGEKYAIVLLARLHVQSGATLRVTGRRPLIVVASQAIRVDGRIDCAAQGPYPGPGGGDSKTAKGCGGGDDGETPSLVLLPPYLGAAGASFGGKGGRGGGGPVSKAPCGPSDLVPLVGGSAGGNGEGAGRGGGGGGAVQLTAWSTVEIGPGGVIDCAGGGGGGADSLGPNSGGGGGSGGAILLEAPRVLVEGILAANGGGGGGGAVIAEAGEAGADGSAGAAPAKGGTGAVGVLSIGGDGGKGSAGSSLDGAGGVDADSGGGGGGGAGRITIRAKARELGTAKSISPAAPPARYETTLEAVD